MYSLLNVHASLSVLLVNRLYQIDDVALTYMYSYIESPQRLITYMHMY